MWSSAKAAVWSGLESDLSTWAPAAFNVRPLRSPSVPAEAPRDAVADAYALGFAEGRSEGERAERARLRPAVRAAEEALEMVNQADARWTGATEQNLVTLAVAIARHIVDRELQIEPEAIDKLVRRSLATFPIDQPVQVRVHPDDLAVINALHAEGPVAAYDREETSISWVGDARISRGGCVLEGRDRIIDGRIETALERVYRRLTHIHA